MVTILGALRAASGPLAFGEVAIGIYGSRTVTRSWRGRPRRVVVPARDTSNLRRALRGLVRCGAIVVVGDDDDFPESARRPHGTRYTVSDRSTGNARRTANAVTSSSLPPEPVVARERLANDLGLDGSDAACVVLACVPANDTLIVPNDGADGVADPTTRRVQSGSRESSNSSVRLTPARGIPASIRGELSVPVRVFAWELGLLSTLADDLLQNLSHAASENDDPNP